MPAPIVPSPTIPTDLISVTANGEQPTPCGTACQLKARATRRGRNAQPWQPSRRDWSGPCGLKPRWLTVCKRPSYRYRPGPNLYEPPSVARDRPRLLPRMRGTGPRHAPPTSPWTALGLRLVVMLGTVAVSYGSPSPCSPRTADLSPRLRLLRHPQAAQVSPMSGSGRARWPEQPERFRADSRAASATRARRC